MKEGKKEIDEGRNERRLMKEGTKEIDEGRNERD